MSGFAEENCIFRTHVGPSAGLTWVCTRYEPDRRIEWTRDWLSLGAAGDTAIAQSSSTDYERMMATHEQEMKHYLRTGTLLTETKH